MKPVVLFVDDEPNILRGLQRLLRSQRDAWDMVFLGGGEEAIDWLGENEADAIVTDMRMPVADGARVLEAAAEKERGRIRLVLSGEADREMTFRTVGRSHQFFAKPCDDVRLVRTIDAAFSMGEELLSPRHQKTIAGFFALPCPQGIMAKLSDCFEKGADPAAVTHVVAQDPGLAMRVLQLANSSYFGRPADTLSIASAVSVVGVETLKTLWQRGGLATIEHAAEVDTDLAEIAARAVETARLAFSVCQSNGASERECEDGYALGLLAWAGNTMSAIREPDGNSVLNRVNPIAAASFATCLYGLPPRTSALLETLARSGPGLKDARSRGEELGAVMFENRRAA